MRTTNTPHHIQTKLEDSAALDLTRYTHKSLKKNNPGSLEIRDSGYISAKLQKSTYIYISMHFPAEMNARGSKTTNFSSFSHDYRGRLLINKDLFSHCSLHNTIYGLKSLLP